MGKLKLLQSSWLLALLSAVLLYLGWAPRTWNALLLVAFVPVLWAVFRPESGARWKLGWVFYFSWFIFLFLQHQSMFFLDDGGFLLFLFIGLFIVPLLWTIPIWISLYLIRKKGLKAGLLIFPFLFVCQEVMHYYWELSFTWMNLGYGVAETPWMMGLFPWTGPEGGSLVIMGCNVALVYLLIQFQQKQISPASFLPLVTVALLLLVPGLFEPGDQQTKEVDLAVFQLPAALRDSLPNDLNGQVDLLANTLREQQFEGADLLICPESYLLDMKKDPLFVNTLDSHYAIKRLQQLSEQYQTPILSGAILVQLYRARSYPTPSAKKKDDRTYYDIYNGSVFIAPNNKVEWRTKQRLLPFAESLPYYSVFNYLEERSLWPVRIQRSYGKANFKGPYQTEKLSLVPAICYEAMFTPVLAEYLKKDPDLVVVLSNHWSGSESAIQQQQSYTQVITRSFGKPVLLVTHDKKSALSELNGGSSRIEGGSLVRLTRKLKSSSYFYVTHSKSPFLWLLISLLVGAVLWWRFPDR